MPLRENVEVFTKLMCIQQTELSNQFKQIQKWQT